MPRAPRTTDSVNTARPAARSAANTRPRVPRRAVHGVLLLDKPLGLSSNDALQKAKRFFRAEKAGHTGTLDPLATGLLPLCFGAATKFSQVSLDADKRYVATLQLGATTTTSDAEGAKDQLQGIGARPHADGVLHLAEARPRRLERGHLRSEDELSVAQHAIDCRIKLGSHGADLQRQVLKRDFDGGGAHRAIAARVSRRQSRQKE